jgi:sugar lactone lactonase YvrE
VDLNGNLTPFAGTFNANYNVIGDGGPALAATLIPEGLAFDAAGNLFFADTLLNRVRRISTAGIISTVTGTGIAGYAGDGGAAGAGQVFEPFAVAPDSAGNLYFTDTGNQRVRKVNLQSLTINLVAGGGVGIGDGGPAVSAQLFAPSGQAVDAAGNLYIADTNNHRVRKVSPSGTITTVAGTGTPGYNGDGGPAAQAQLSGPAGVWVDA